MAGVTSTTFTTEFSSDLSSSYSILSNPTVNDANPEQARFAIEKQQLLHQCEMMKIEIEQKTSQIKDLRAQHHAEVDELEERVKSLQNTNQVMNLKLSSAINEHKRELAASQEENRTYIAQLKQKQSELEYLLPGLQVKAAELRNFLLNLHVTQDTYANLVGKNRADLTIKELISVVYYESQLPLIRRVEDTTSKLRSAREDHETSKKEIRVLEENLAAARKKRVEIEAENSSLLRTIDDLTHQLDPAHKANYRNVLQKSTELEATNRQLVTANTFMKAELGSLKDDHKKLESSTTHLNQQVALLNQDKQYLEKENAELSTRIHRLDEKAENLRSELNSAKRARDSVYEELINVRHTVQEEHEKKLELELQTLKQHTAADIQHIKDTAVKVYEREKQILLDSKEAAVADRNNASRKLREVQQKYQDLSDSYHDFQTTTNAKVADIKNELKLKEFELERVSLLHSELSSKYSNLARDHDKTSKKLEVMLEDYNSVRMTHSDEVNTLTLKLRSAERQVDTITKGDNINDVISILGEDSFNVNRRVLAKKLVELSRSQEVLKETLAVKTEALEKSVSRCEELEASLRHSHQPAGYLVESIKKKELLISQLKVELKQCSEELEEQRGLERTLRAEREELRLDMEKVLKNREQLNTMKKFINTRIEQREPVQPKPIIMSN